MLRQGGCDDAAESGKVTDGGGVFVRDTDGSVDRSNDNGRLVGADTAR